MTWRVVAGRAVVCWVKASSEEMGVRADIFEGMLVFSRGNFRVWIVDKTKEVDEWKLG